MGEQLSDSKALALSAVSRTVLTLLGHKSYKYTGWADDFERHLASLPTWRLVEIRRLLENIC